MAKKRSDIWKEFIKWAQQQNLSTLTRLPRKTMRQFISTKAKEWDIQLDFATEFDHNSGSSLIFIMTDELLGVVLQKEDERAREQEKKMAKKR